MGNQRTAYWAQINGTPCSNVVTPERIAALEAVPGWVWRVDLDEQWMEKLSELKAYVEQHGHLPPRSHKTLGSWISTQRKAYWAQINGTPSTHVMTPERIAALEAVPGWVWNENDAAWQSKYEEVKAYVEQHGHLPSTSHKTLGKWINTQRAAYWAQINGTPCNHVMTPERIAALEAVPGWSWKPTPWCEC